MNSRTSGGTDRTRVGGAQWNGSTKVTASIWASRSRVSHGQTQTGESGSAMIAADTVAGLKWSMVASQA